MPTNHDETLAERYMRELQTELAIYSRMTPEQISDMATELHNALAARDAALAELAALKGGQEAVAMIRYARGVPGFENEMPHVVSCNDLPDGLYPVYLAPPAQASAWVAVSERLPESGIDVFVVGVKHGAVYHTVAGLFHDKWASQETEEATRFEPTHWQPLPTAPTPGASDGKGGKP